MTEEFQRLIGDDLKQKQEDDDIEAKFEKTSSDYVAILENIADTLKALDDDFLLNLLGKEKHEAYKKNQVERQDKKMQSRG